MKSDQRASVFVSHHSSKAAEAEEIEKALAKRGVDCWIAPRDVPPGEPFDMAVRDAIEQSSAVLLLFCAQSDRSKHVKRELILADSSHRPIIPVRLENINPGELAYHLADSQWVDWVERREAVVDRVALQARNFEAMRRREADQRAVAARAAVLGGAVAEAPPATPPPATADPEDVRRRKRAFAVVGGLALAVLLWNLPIWGEDSEEDGGFSVTIDDSESGAPGGEGSVRIDREARTIVIGAEREEADNAAE